jgi:hypothetical protein
MVGCERVLGAQGLDVRRTVLALIGLVAAGLLWSCSGRSTDDGDAPTRPVSEGDFVQAVADAMCANLGDCCAEAAIPYDRAGCEAYVFAELDLDPPPNATWDSVQAGKCVDLFARIASTCSYAGSGDNPCQRVYRGTLPEGAACVDDDECADIRGSDATCAYDDVTPSGTCTRVVPPVRGKAGDACMGTCGTNSCTGFGSPVEEARTCYVEDGVICSLSSYVCVPPPALGEACNDFYCVAGAYCSSLDLICRAPKPNGASCEFAEECTGGLCSNFVCGTRTLASTELCNGT